MSSVTSCWLFPDSTHVSARACVCMEGASGAEKNASWWCEMKKKKFEISAHIIYSLLGTAHLYVIFQMWDERDRCWQLRHLNKLCDVIAAAQKYNRWGTGTWKLWGAAGPSNKTGTWTAVNQLLVTDYDLEKTSTQPRVQLLSTDAFPPSMWLWWYKSTLY